jgi:hypothetical protein
MQQQVQTLSNAVKIKDNLLDKTKQQLIFLKETAGSDGKQKLKSMDRSTRDVNKSAVKAASRKFKFVNQPKQLKAFGDMVMDELELDSLTLHEGLSPKEREIILSNREVWRANNEDVWISLLNDERSYWQVSPQWW